MTYANLPFPRRTLIGETQLREGDILQYDVDDFRVVKPDSVYVNKKVEDLKLDPESHAPGQPAKAYRRGEERTPRSVTAPKEDRVDTVLEGLV